LKYTKINVGLFGQKCILLSLFFLNLLSKLASNLNVNHTRCSEMGT